MAHTPEVKSAAPADTATTEDEAHIADSTPKESVAYTPTTVTVLKAKNPYDKEKNKTVPARETKVFDRIDGKVQKVKSPKPWKYVPRAVEVGDIRGYHKLRAEYEKKLDTIFILGAYVGAEKATIEKGGGVRRTAGRGDNSPLNFVDREVALLTFDIDEFRPTGDPVADPLAAILEYISKVLPACFHGKTFDWALSSSAGMVYWQENKEIDTRQVLKAHVTFQIETPYMNTLVEQWAGATSPLIDRTVFRCVQPHFIAAPLFEDGVEDPFPNGRSGLYEGPQGDVVPLVIEAALVEAKPKAKGGAKIDMRAKPGVIGAFCRAFINEEVVTDERLLGEEFYMTNDRVHFDWNKATPGACFLRDDHFVGCNNDTWGQYFDSVVVNIWDLVRVLKFGDLDKSDDEFVQMGIDNSPIQDKPSQKAMEKFALSFAEVRAEMAENKPRLGDLILRSIAKIVSRGDDLEQLAVDLEFENEKISKVFASLAWNSTKSKFWLMTPNAGLVISSENDLRLMISEHFGRLLNNVRSVVEQAASAMGKKPAWVNQAVKVIEAKPFNYLGNKAKAHRQVTNADLEVDMFAETGGMRYIDSTATLVFTHRPFREGNIDPELLADYKKHFPEFDEFIYLLAAARFASTRKKAHLWLHCDSDWGKSLLMSVLDRLGLVVETTVSELEKMLSGGPVGKTIEDFRRVWCLCVDEFKGVSRELKQTSEYIHFAPKNLATVRAPLFLKLFMSAESVDSLASKETGIEDQFANRFTYIQGKGSIDDRFLFIDSKSRYLETLTNYVALQLNSRVEYFRSLGAIAAADAADIEVTKFYGRYKIERLFKRLSVMLGDLTRRFAEDCAAAYQAMKDGKRLSRFQAEVVPHIGEHKTHGLCLSQPKTMASLWLEHTFTKSERGKLGYKLNDIVNGLGEIKTRRLVGMDETKCVLLNIPTTEPGGVKRVQDADDDFGEPLKD